MISSEFSQQLFEKVEDFLNIKITKVQRPKQGMDSEVFLIDDAKSNTYAIKFSKNASNDVLAYNLILKNEIDIPVPKVHSHFTFENKQP